MSFFKRLFGPKSPDLALSFPEETLHELMRKIQAVEDELPSVAEPPKVVLRVYADESYHGPAPAPGEVEIPPELRDHIASIWTLEERVDPLTDKVASTAGGTGKQGTSGAHIALHYTEGSAPAAIVTPGEDLGPDESLDARYRIDKGELHEGSWSHSDNSLFRYGPDALHFARNLAKGHTLIFDASGSRFDLDLSGAEEVVALWLRRLKIPRVPAEDIIPGLRPLHAREIELWGPRGLVLYKRALIELGYPLADAAPRRTADLYIAVQNFVDNYLRAAYAGKVTSTVVGAYVSMHRISPKTAELPLASSMLYEAAPASLRSHLGALKLGD